MQHQKLNAPGSHPIGKGSSLLTKNAQPGHLAHKYETSGSILQQQQAIEIMKPANSTKKPANLKNRRLMQQSSGKNMQESNRSLNRKAARPPSVYDQTSGAESSNYNHPTMVQDGGTGTSLKRVVLH